MNEIGGAQKNVVSGRKRLGELLIEGGVITKEQLQEALARQSQVAEHIGSVLISMGYVTLEGLLEFLGKQTGVPAVNLFKVNIDPAVVKLVSREKMETLRILPIAADASSVVLAMENPQDFNTISELGFSLGKKIKPVVVPSYMMSAALARFFGFPDNVLRGAEISRQAQIEQEEMDSAPRLESLVSFMVRSRASDMFLTAGVPPSLKIVNQIKRMSLPSLSPEDCDRYARELLNDDQWQVFEERREIDLGITYPKLGRFRCSVFRQRGSSAIAIRNLPEAVSSLPDLNLPEWIRDFALRPSGLVMVCGPAGHGKSTTLCAMVDIINNHRRCNIVTLEDPVEFLHKHKLSNINQREVGRDTDTFQTGLRAVFRQAPDVIVVGEMRDSQSFEIGLRAANTGHLVITTVHATNTTSIIDTVVNMFEPFRQVLIRNTLADCLLLCLSQRLVPLKNGTGRILALEKLINTHRIKNLIREGKPHHI